VRLSQEISRLRRVKSPLSIIMAGVDGLEGLLSKHGATFKDAVLVKVGSAIKRVIRFNDLPCRYEGDKFAIILPDTANEGSHIAAGKILETIHSLSVRHLDHEEKVTVTLAIVEFKVTMNIGQFIETAERLLATAQRQGGNRIVDESLPV
jgi:diguanylate cyclase (GGDEF)-like protein